ncbi:MAG: hypothetical protein AMS15_06745 [Planctomycetes bacterium DG_23]|nr:MAG: hypothetical protein AMS15_06745 [Planctomycetes bacterium DG_23]
MKVFSRVSDIISANINDLLDRAENPEKMARQMVRELEEALIAVRREVVLAIAAERRLTRRLEQEGVLAKDWQARAEEAVKKGQDDLARRALAKKREHTFLTKGLGSQAELARAHTRRLKEHLNLFQEKVTQAKRRRDLLIARHRATRAEKKMRKPLLDLPPTGEVGGLARMEEKVEAAEAEVEALREITEAKEPLEAEFLEMEEAEALEKELRELKEKVRAKKKKAQRRSPA